MSTTPNFIIHAPSYKEDSGGIIVLHKLCHVLNELGYQASLWPNFLGTRATLRKKVKAYLKKPAFVTHPDYNAPLANKSSLNDKSIVIYPEVVYGNPLGAKNVVRWLLHKPGFHTGSACFGDNELIFSFDDYCIEPGFGVLAENKLFVLSLSPFYTALGAGERSGSCYMMRKGKGRKVTHDLVASVQIDGLNHQETAEMFRKTKTFYSYDELTLYSQYAALCGCVSVVIPEKFSTRQEWAEKHPISKYGIAYGYDDIEHSIKTMHKVPEYFSALEQKSLETVARFAEVAISNFN